MGLNECQTFTAKFDVTTELAGYPKAVLLMSCHGHDNFDIVVQIRKIDNKGRQLSHLNYPCPVAIDQVPDVNTAKTWGPQGFLRASHHISLNAEGGPIVSDDSSRETDVFFTATTFDSPSLQNQKMRISGGIMFTQEGSTTAISSFLLSWGSAVSFSYTGAATSRSRQLGVIWEPITYNAQ
ncbi:hypothetical protein NW765_006451 [Fusarium oxysporum]|nr:hypothetical protein NW765_006451 [Fusarium oxysporum]